MPDDISPEEVVRQLNMHCLLTWRWEPFGNHGLLFECLASSYKRGDIGALYDAFTPKTMEVYRSGTPEWISVEMSWDPIFDGEPTEH